MNEDISNKISELKQKSEPWLGFNRRGQLLILIPATVIVLFLRFILYLVSDYGVLVLNIVAFVLIFFWVTRIVFTEVRMDKKTEPDSAQKRNFILIASVCFLILNFSLLVDQIIVSPFIVLSVGLFSVVWVFSLVLDKVILRDTFVHFYFKYLTLIVISIIVINIIIALIIN